MAVTEKKATNQHPLANCMSDAQFEAFMDRAFPSLTKDYGYAIVVLSHGFVYVGDVTLVGDELAIGRALNVRQWGTSKGLGQLTIEGPQKETVLDRCGGITAPRLALIHIMGVTPAAKKNWEKNPVLVGHN